MVRLMDIGLERLKNMTIDMAKLSENTVSTAIDAYIQSKDVSGEIHKWSEELRILQDEVSELAVEVIARYQPVASDLRFIRSCMEISYGFSRFGRYAYDISQVLGTFGDLSKCDKSLVKKAGEQAKEMIRMSIKSFTGRDAELAKKVRNMDSVVDEIYLQGVENAAKTRQDDFKCSVSALLILRYLERIADHATYIGDSVVYTITGERSPRK
ncbi:MAG: phosphate uptake regulator PhoU [Thaumarchaeota archaeon]|nr:phosphate uptake regulator PhoU [Nitrososphaerota archaeon]